MKMSMSKSFLALAAAGLMAFAPGAFAWDHGHGGYGGYRGGYHGGGYGYGRGHYDSGGRWIAGALIAGVVGGAIYSATRPAPVYYDQPVVYSRPVVYERPVVVERRVYQTNTVYDDGGTTYVRDDGYYGR